MGHRRSPLPLRPSPSYADAACDDGTGGNGDGSGVRGVRGVRGGGSGARRAGMRLGQSVPGALSPLGVWMAQSAAEGGPPPRGGPPGGDGRPFPPPQGPLQEHGLLAVAPPAGDSRGNGSGSRWPPPTPAFPPPPPLPTVGPTFAAAAADADAADPTDGYRLFPAAPIPPPPPPYRLTNGGSGGKDNLGGRHGARRAPPPEAPRPSVPPPLPLPLPPPPASRRSNGGRRASLAAPVLGPSIPTWGRGRGGGSPPLPSPCG